MTDFQETVFVVVLFPEKVFKVCVCYFRNTHYTFDLKTLMKLQY